MRWKLPPVRAAGAAVTACLLVSGCATAEAGEQPTVLRVSSGLSSLNIAWTAGSIPWMEEVEERTGGDVTFESFTGGELVELRRETHALESEVIDIALMLPIYQPDQYPLVEVTMLPLKESDTLIGSTAWKSLVEGEEALFDGQTYHEWQFESEGLKALPLHTTPEYSVSTTGAAFESTEVLESLQLRTASRVQNITAELFGANTVSIPNAEAYDALSRGTIDGGFAAVADWGNYGLQDLYRTTLTGVNFGHFNLNMVMTDDTWNSLDPEVRDIMQQALEDTYEQAAGTWMDRTDETRSYNEDEADGRFVDLADVPDEVRTPIEESASATWTEWIDMMEARGLPGREAAEQWKKAVEDAGGEVPDGALEDGA
ncbi:MAG: hypothetical protein ACTHVY_11680 [Brevibacterium yomogidense]|uniref:TRAP transporter substrate-binding protein DctP n=1 Tax=Brevibacterium sp. Mu109 TaxID=1255669 RepID=UPI000C632939|nr:TRAP transporter substrate-binding protein DctP [Brevibacterium sp. Mu109]SMX77920.1 TRAP-type C4-dicarboxylate transport system, substrate-binding protein [Brevibacterium sp. Mu109]